MHSWNLHPKFPLITPDLNDPGFRMLGKLSFPTLKIRNFMNKVYKVIRILESSVTFREVEACNPIYEAILLVFDLEHMNEEETSLSSRPDLALLRLMPYHVNYCVITRKRLKTCIPSPLLLCCYSGLAFLTFIYDTLKDSDRRIFDDEKRNYFHSMTSLAPYSRET